MLNNSGIVENLHTHLERMVRALDEAGHVCPSKDIRIIEIEPETLELIRFRALGITDT